MHRTLIPSLLLFLLAGTAAADVVILKDGRRIEGEVLEQSAAKVVVKTKFARMEFKGAEVERVERTETPLAEFKRRRAETPDDDADALFELYLFAKEKGLPSQANQVLRDIVKADPDHENARRLLGHVRHGDRWVTQEEAAELAAEAERKEKEALGLVLHDGRWITKEEKERIDHEAAGDVLLDGKWVDKAEYERRTANADAQKEAEEHRARGEVLLNGAWKPKAEAEKYYSDLEHPYLAQGEKTVVLTTRGIDFGDRMVTTTDRAWRDAAKLMGGEPELKAGAKAPVFIVDELAEYNTLGNTWGDEKSSNFTSFTSPWNPSPAFDLVSVTMYYKSDELTDVYATHATVEQFVRRFTDPEGEEPPRWFRDGIAEYLARWSVPARFKWSRDRLRAVGDLPKLKNFLSKYTPDERNILAAGALVAFLESSAAPASLKEEFGTLKEMVRTQGKFQKVFKAFEKELQKNEQAFVDFVNA